MARQFNPKTLEILSELDNKPEGLTSKQLYKTLGGQMPYKEFYNILFRLSDLEFISKEKKIGNDLIAQITPEGKKLLLRKKPKKDGIWKLVIFDIPEKQKKVRSILRAKLKALYFKKWQNSIWISPYELDEEIESEMKDLAEKFFVRLIKVKSINKTDDLEKLFP